MSSLFWKMRLGIARGSQFNGMLSNWPSVDNWASVLPQNCEPVSELALHGMKMEGSIHRPAPTFCVRMAEGTPTCVPQGGSEETIMS